MAVLTDLSINGELRASSILNTGQDYTPWYRIYHCVDSTDTSICNPTYSCGYIHVRTPLPADYNSGVTHIPSLLEVMGFHTYSGEYTHYFKAVVNVDSGNNFQANKRIDIGNEDVKARVYRSSSQYGGKNRVCFSMRKYPCCCVGWFWVRWRMNAGFFEDYPWATLGHNDLNANVY